ncbi:MAG TPA: hypothetical protein PLQ89_17460, partial [Phycisphaerae bacterium]|nr:hypothetical protein [Phycisphaerae bacterium]
DDLDVAGRTFSEILESFQIVRTETQQKQIEAALERGADLLQRAGHGEKKITDRILEPVTLRLTREGQPVGMVEIHEKVDKIAGKEGVRNLQQAWIFNPDGSVQFLQEEKFISADFTYDEWRNLTQLMPSKQTDPKQRVIMHMEAGIRRGDQLIVKYAGQNPNDRQDKAIEIDRSYGSTGLPLLLPRLVDLDSPELYAFSMYDTERRGMSLRTLRVAGPAQVTVAGRRVSGYKIEDCEGLLPPVNEIIVDRSGRPVHLASGAVEMTLVSPEQLEAEFGERIRATQKQFRESMGLPEPSAQPQAGPAGKSRAPETKTRSPGRTRGRSRTR